MLQFPLSRFTPSRQKTIGFLSRFRGTLALVLAAVLFSVPLGFSAQAYKGQVQTSFGQITPAKLDDHDEGLTAEGPAFVIHQVNGKAVCRNATPEELTRMKRRNLNQKLRPINHPERLRGRDMEGSPLDETTTSGSQGMGSGGQGGTTATLGTQSALEPSAGLTIILRATAQLEANPAAKAAFIKAANHWEAIIQTPITVVIDVDYGTTRFGQAWDSSNTLGSTENGASPVPSYQSFRSSLVAGQSNADETALYAQLPAGFSGLPTDLPTPTVTDIIVNTPVARALGRLPADATTDTNSSVPSIGFNANFNFDFDSSNGIGVGQTDFDSVATHEIGHALGFTSVAGWGRVTLTSQSGLGRLAYLASPWDIFRFKSTSAPSSANFSTLARTLTVGTSSSDLQLAFLGANVPQPGLSTGGPDGEAGDKNQSSHWRADELGGTYFGIMDPTIAPRQRYTITDNDKRALDFMGYRVVGISSPGSTTPPPTIINLTSGQPMSSTIDAPPVDEGVLSQTQYTIQVPAGATQLTINLSGNPNDVDLHVKYGSPVTVSGSVLVDDTRANGPTGTETITLTPTSAPALKAGTYYIGVVNYGPGGANFTLTATVTTPNPAPVVITEEGTNRAVALDSVTQLRGPFPITSLFNFSADHLTRVMIFTSNLGINPGDDISSLVITVTVQGVNVPVERVGTLAGVNNASYVIVRLNNSVPIGNNLPLFIMVRGVLSNTATIDIKAN